MATNRLSTRSWTIRSTLRFYPSNIFQQRNYLQQTSNQHFKNKISRLNQLFGSEGEKHWMSNQCLGVSNVFLKSDLIQRIYNGFDWIWTKTCHIIKAAAAAGKMLRKVKWFWNILNWGWNSEISHINVLRVKRQKHALIENEWDRREDGMIALHESGRLLSECCYS